jgi:hypothetical protein
VAIFSLCPHKAVPWFVSLYPFLMKTPTILYWGPTQWPHLTTVTSKDPKSSHLLRHWELGLKLMHLWTGVLFVPYQAGTRTLSFCAFFPVSDSCFITWQRRGVQSHQREQFVLPDMDGYNMCLLEHLISTLVTLILRLCSCFLRNQRFQMPARNLVFFFFQFEGSVHSKNRPVGCRLFLARFGRQGR